MWPSTRWIYVQTKSAFAKAADSEPPRDPLLEKHRRENFCVWAAHCADPPSSTSWVLHHCSPVCLLPTHLCLPFLWHMRRPHSCSVPFPPPQTTAIVQVSKWSHDCSRRRMPLQKGEGTFGRDAWVIWSPGSSSTRWEAVTGKGARGFLSENNRLGDERERDIVPWAPTNFHNLQKPHTHTPCRAAETLGTPPSLPLLAASPEAVDLFQSSSSSSPQWFISAFLHSSLPS